MRFDEEEQDEACLELPNIRGKGSPSKRRLKPIVANLADTQYEVVEEVCWQLDYSLHFEKEGQWDLRWTDGAVSVEALSKMASHQKVNHFPGMNTLSRKNNLAKNMLKMMARFPEHYSYIPRTFLLPHDLPLLRSYHMDHARRGRPRYYIAKPQASSQGRGIFLSDDLPEIEAYGQCVVQSYIDNPLLYKGLKFDMRIYALVAGCDPLRLYIYNQGLVRFATEKYEPVCEQNRDNLYMHLTNYAINKDSPKYVFNESLDDLSLGHKKSLAEFFQTLKGQGLPAHEYWSGIKDCIVKTVISGQAHLQHEYRMAQPHNIPNNMCFQVLGFDFMIDDQHRLYLLQINYTPSFSTETPLDHLIKSNLIRDTLVLMNVAPAARNHAQKIAKEELERRVYTGKTLKLTADQRDRLVRLHQQERDEYEKKHLGSFQKIYPSRNQERQQKYQKLLEYAAEQYKELSSPQRIGHNKRSNSKYRIKRIISNNTINNDDQRENDAAKPTKNYNNPSNNNPSNNNHSNSNKPTLILNPERTDRTANFKPNQDIFHPRHQSRHGNFGQQMRAMDLGSLKTKQQQKTMFSKQYAYAQP